MTGHRFESVGDFLIFALRWAGMLMYVKMGEKRLSVSVFGISS